MDATSRLSEDFYPEIVAAALEVLCNLLGLSDLLPAKEKGRAERGGGGGGAMVFGVGAGGVVHVGGGGARPTTPTRSAPFGGGAANLIAHYASSHRSTSAATTPVSSLSFSREKDRDRGYTSPHPSSQGTSHRTPVSHLMQQHTPLSRSYEKVSTPFSQQSQEPGT